MAAVPLVTRDGRRLWAHVDALDWELVVRFGPWYPWIRGTNLYPECMFQINGDRIRIFMHSLLLGPPPEHGLRISHLNGNGLDNHRSNLAFQTQSQLLARRKPSVGVSRYKGVCWDAANRKWMVQFRGKKIGRYTDEVVAARAFDAAARNFWGNDCYQNFPETT